MLQKPPLNRAMIRNRGFENMVKAASRTAASAKATTGSAAKPVVTITLKQIAAQVADTQGLSKKQAEAVLNETMARISKSITKGHRVRVGALGIFSVKKLGARKGRNPATGEPIKIKASKKVAFRATKELKEAL
jgi:DNA-binding protein HU-beta